MQRFLITGVGGFVGRYFLEYLEKHISNYIVCGIDVMPRYDINLSSFIYHQVDMTNRLRMYKIIENFLPDYIVHLASYSSVSQSWKIPAESFINNTNIFLNLVEAVREQNLSTRILSIGSSEEYGNRDQTDMPLHEDYELRPSSPYAVARVSQEMLSKLYADYFDLDIVMSRSFNHIGPRQRDVFVVPSFIRQLINISKTKSSELHVGNIEVIRDFLDVRDVIEAYFCILKKGEKGRIYNVCSGQGYRLREIIDLASNILNIIPTIIVDEERIRPTDNLCIIGDNSRLRNELNWNPRYDLSRTIQDMISNLQQEERNK